MRGHYHGALGWRKTTSAVERPSLRDIAWAAGIWEGEGGIGSARGSRMSFHMRVIQKDVWILQRLQAMFGGSIGLHSKKQGVSHWSISGARARGFMFTIFTFLSPRRRDQVKRVIGHNVVEEALPRGI